MSTQHPDNVKMPSFASDPEIIGGKDEVTEAFYAYSELGCDEQMWDVEGKEASRSVVRELFEEHPDFFKENKLGEDLRLTIRIPNPRYERVEQKVILEMLENIPHSYDVAKKFYGEEVVPPIYEIILPMTTSFEDLERLYCYYQDHVSGKETQRVFDKTIGEWIGEIRPKRLNVIPLFEEMDYMLNSHNVVRDFLEGKELEYQRVFFARSDPAMYYGLVAAVLLNKIALTRLQELDENVSADICPIIGAGSPPFRGNLSPDRVEEVLEEYPSAQTYTIQSAFKYDHPKEKSSEAIKKIKNFKRRSMEPVDEKKCLSIIEKTRRSYVKKISKLADTMNVICRNIPRRRLRKLHVGPFGYSRELEGPGGGIKLPRAISFTASFYSIGIPPEIIGFSALTDKDIEFLTENAYKNILIDLRDAMQYYNENALKEFPFLEEDARRVQEYIDVETNEKHEELTDQILKQKTEKIKDKIVQAAEIRNFLG